MVRSIYLSRGLAHETMIVSGNRKGLIFWKEMGTDSIFGNRKEVERLLNLYLASRLIVIGGTA